MEDQVMSTGALVVLMIILFLGTAAVSFFVTKRVRKRSVGRRAQKSAEEESEKQKKQDNIIL